MSLKKIKLQNRNTPKNIPEQATVLSSPENVLSTPSEFIAHPRSFFSVTPSADPVISQIGVVGEPLSSELPMRPPATPPPAPFHKECGPHSSAPPSLLFSLPRHIYVPEPSGFFPSFLILLPFGRYPHQLPPTWTSPIIPEASRGSKHSRFCAAPSAWHNARDPVGIR